MPDHPLTLMAFSPSTISIRETKWRFFQGLLATILSILPLSESLIDSKVKSKQSCAAPFR